MKFEVIQGNPEIKRRRSKVKLKAIDCNDELERRHFTRMEVEFFFYPPRTDRRKLCEPGLEQKPDSMLAEFYLREEFTGVKADIPFLADLKVIHVESVESTQIRPILMRDARIVAKAELYKGLMRNGKDVDVLFQKYEAMCSRLDSALHVRMWDCVYEFKLRADAQEQLPPGVYAMCNTINNGSRGKIQVMHNLTPYRDVFTQIADSSLLST